STQLFFFPSRRRHTRCYRDWSSDVCSSDLERPIAELQEQLEKLKKHPETRSLGVSLEEEIALIEKKLEETKRQIFLNLSAWDRKIGRASCRERADISEGGRMNKEIRERIVS